MAGLLDGVSQWWDENFNQPTKTTPETYPELYNDEGEYTGIERGRIHKQNVENIGGLLGVEKPTGTKATSTPVKRVQNPSLLAETSTKKPAFVPANENTPESRKTIDRNITEEGGKEMQPTGNMLQDLKTYMNAQAPNIFDKDGETLPEYNTPEIQKGVEDTQKHISDASEDETSWLDTLSRFGINKENAMGMWNSFTNVADRVDWLTAATVAAAAASSGSNATKSIANGLLRGMETRGVQKAREASMALEQAKSQEGARRWSAEQGIRQQQADAATAKAKGGLLAAENKAKANAAEALSADERAVADTVSSVDGDVAQDVVYQAASLLKSKGYQVSPSNVRKAVSQLKKAGLVTDNTIKDDTLL